jgi:hypothetical protein
MPWTGALWVPGYQVRVPAPICTLGVLRDVRTAAKRARKFVREYEAIPVK